MDEVLPYLHPTDLHDYGSCQAHTQASADTLESIQVIAATTEGFVYASTVPCEDINPVNESLIVGGKVSTVPCEGFTVKKDGLNIAHHIPTTDSADLKIRSETLDIAKQANTGDNAVIRNNSDGLDYQVPAAHNDGLAKRDRLENADHAQGSTASSVELEITEQESIAYKDTASKVSNPVDNKITTNKVREAFLIQTW